MVAHLGLRLGSSNETIIPEPLLVDGAPKHLHGLFMDKPEEELSGVVNRSPSREKRAILLDTG